MKPFRFIGTTLIVLAALSSLGALAAAAEGQIGDSPATAPFIDNQGHTIQANAGMWFRFDYDAVDRAVTTITLADGNKNHMRFEVWTPDAAADTADNKPIGRGTTHTVACDDGTCQTNDLIWVGAFGTDGTYYVDVVNDNNVAMNAFLTISGAGVSLGPPTFPAPAPTTSNAPTAPPTSPNNPPTSLSPAAPVAIAQNMDDPAKALALDNASHTLAAQSAMWFRFEYGPTDTDAKPLKTITLLNGNRSGVRFEVWTPDHVSDWWNNQKPVGQGTVMTTDCDTGQPSDSGQCQSNDLTWMGAFNTGGSYYVRVVNDNTQPATFAMTSN